MDLSFPGFKMKLLITCPTDILLLCHEKRHDINAEQLSMHFMFFSLIACRLRSYICSLHTQHWKVLWPFLWAITGGISLMRRKVTPNIIFTPSIPLRNVYLKIHKQVKSAQHDCNSLLTQLREDEDLVNLRNCTACGLTPEKAMAPHSSTLAWKIPWMEEPGRLQFMGSRRVGHNWATSLSFFHLHALEE